VISSVHYRPTSSGKAKSWLAAASTCGRSVLVSRTPRVPEARHQFADAFKALDVGRKIDLLILIGRWGCQWHLRGQLLERLGIAVEMKPNTKLFPPTEVLYAAVPAATLRSDSIKSAKISAQPNRPTPLPAAVSVFRTTPSSPWHRLRQPVQTDAGERGHVPSSPAARRF